MFSKEEVEMYRDHFEKFRLQRQYDDTHIADPTSNDPLKQYPRQMQMHRHDQLSLDFLCDPRINKQIQELTGFEPFAVQTMFYFKPAGARGQALHQDNFYLKASPSTCIAAWLAVDDCDEENGCLMVVPGSQNLPVLCLTKSDTSKSFTDVEVPVPDGMEVRPAIMKAGDVMFFNGQVIHGSNPNTSKDRFRRSLISHYVIGDCDAVGKWYFPVYRMDQTQVEFNVNEGGGKCGEWVEVDGSYTVEMTEKSDRDLISITE
jgi:ectoine hydroxylase-related dioxygenase (phytanoyl-CoA dioxygenase family)